MGWACADAVEPCGESGPYPIVPSAPPCRPGQVRFQLAPDAPALHIGCAPPHEPPATDYSAAALLQALAPDKLVRLLACAMLEYQVPLR